MNEVEEPSNDKQNPVAHNREPVGPTGSPKGKLLVEENLTRYHSYVSTVTKITRRLSCLRCNAASGSTNFRSWKANC